MIGPEEDLPTLISQSDHLNVLRYIRAHKIRQPTTVVTHGKLLLGITTSTTSTDNNKEVIIPTKQRPNNNIGDAERLAALEQLCIASLDIGNIPLAEYCLDAMQVSSSSSDASSGVITKESTRFRKLLGLCLEASGDYIGASDIYDKLLQDNPSNSHAAKRKYCILAAQFGKEDEAMKVLNEYLSQHPGDVAAWNTMAEVCLSVSDFTGAAYCYEEVILGQPLDSNIHCKLGEVYCTAGGLSNTKLARKHLAQAVQLDPNNLRAWYGLIGAAEGYLQEVDKISNKNSSKKDAEQEGVAVANELIKFAGEKLVQVYKGDKMMMKIVEKILMGEC